MSMSRLISRRNLATSLTWAARPRPLLTGASTLHARSEVTSMALLGSTLSIRSFGSEEESNPSAGYRQTPRHVGLTAGDRNGIFGRQRQVTCHTCGEPGHTARDCSQQLCYNCQQPGHISSDCQNAQVCRTCKEEGHHYKDCPQAPAPRERSANAAPWRDDSTDPRTLYVGNMPWSATEDQVRERFAEYGAVSSVRMPVNKATGGTKGFGYVQFEDAEDAQRALEHAGTDAAEPFVFDGRALVVARPRPYQGENRPEGRGGGGGYRGGRGSGGGGGGGGYRRGGSDSRGEQY